MSTVLQAMNETEHEHGQRSGWRAPGAVPAGQRPAEPLWTWLRETGPLTGHLRAFCGPDFRVTLLRESETSLTPGEARLLDSAATAFCREVLLGTPAHPLVHARTLLPQPADSGWLRALGTTPLGETLFARADTQREALEIMPLTEDMPLYQSARRHGGRPVWARRSLLRNADVRLLLLECLFEPES